MYHRGLKLCQTVYATNVMPAFVPLRPQAMLYQFDLSSQRLSNYVGHLANPCLGF